MRDAQYTSTAPRWRSWSLAGGALIIVLAALAVVLGLRGHGAPAQAHDPGIVHPIGANVVTPWGAVRAQDGTLAWSRNLAQSTAPLNVNGILYTVQTTYHVDSVEAIRSLDGTQVWSVALSCIPSAPVQAGTSVVVPCFTPQSNAARNGTFTLLALDLLTGHTLWHSAPVASAIPPTVDTPVPYISALSYQNGQIVAIYNAANQTPIMAAWNAATGAQSWQHGVGDAQSFAWADAATQPVGGLNIVSYRGTQTIRIVAVDAASGAQRWSITANQAELDALTDMFVITSSGNTITAWHTQDGTSAWSVSLPNTGLLKYAQFVAQQGATLIYRADEACQAPSNADCAALFALNIASGQKLWQHTLPANMPYNAISFFFDGTTLIASTFYPNGSGNTYTLFALNGSNGSLIWSHSVGNLYEIGVMTSGRLFVYGGGSQCIANVYSYSTVTGTLVWQHAFMPATCIPPYMWRAWMVVVQIAG